MFFRSRPSTAKARASSISSGSSDGELQPALMPSLFPNVPPTVNFVPDGQKVEQLPWEYRRLLKWRMSPITPNVVKNCIARSGFRATKSKFVMHLCYLYNVFYEYSDNKLFDQKCFIFLQRIMIGLVTGEST